MKNIIYALVDPRNDLVCYIGKSSARIDRTLTHLYSSHSDDVNNWIKELSKIWLYPDIVIIEEVLDLNDLHEKEKDWIEYYSQINLNLFNKNSKDKYFSEKKISKEEVHDFEIISRSIGNIHLILTKQRVVREISQSELAKMMNCSRSTISLFERGNNVNIDILKAYNLALKTIGIKRKMVMKRVRKPNQNEPY